MRRHVNQCGIPFDIFMKCKTKIDADPGGSPWKRKGTLDSLAMMISEILMSLITDESKS